MESCIRIVLVDDDPICHLITSKMIKRFTTHEVEAFTNPQEALTELMWRASQAEDKFPDLILLDIDMPRMDGWQFLNEFHKLPPHILEDASIIMLSSSNHSSDVERAKKYPAVKDFFSKPFTEDMVKTIQMAYLKSDSRGSDC
jgi:CheY-like chemotaxis protein